ncbi:MAG TPA: hypothetical protein DIU35_19090 [Candidatus Latescibacteria bacterium]|nr:hypothetical protein [Candidatus Latescibacterota bacterium]
MSDPPSSRREPEKQMENFLGNVWKFYVCKVLLGLSQGVVIPIVVLYFHDRGISLTGFMILMTVLNFSQFVLEVPTGIVADKFSRKWSVFSGFVIWSISLLIMLTTTNYPLLILSFVGFGLFSALLSGADTALLYDSLKTHRKEEKFQKTLGNGISLQLLAMVLGTISCGIIVDITGLSGTMWASFGTAILASIVTSLFKEPSFLDEVRAEEKTQSFTDGVSSYLLHLKESFQYIGRSRELIALIFINIVIFRICLFTDRPFAQPYLSSFEYSPVQISYFYTIFNGTAALFARYSDRVGKILGSSERRSISLIGALGTVSLVIMGNAWMGPLAVLAIVGIYLMKGLFEPFIQDGLNRRISSEKRASCLSISAMGNNFLGLFLGPFFGYLADVYSLGTSLLTFQWTFAPLLVVGVIWGWRVLGRIHEPEPTVR